MPSGFWMPSCRKSETLTRLSEKKRHSPCLSSPKAAGDIREYFSCAIRVASSTRSTTTFASATFERSCARWLSVTCINSSGYEHASSWYLKPIVIRSKSLSIDDSFSRMIDEWARRSKICRVECIEYTSCPRKSSEMNFGLYIVRITSCSTPRRLVGRHVLRGEPLLEDVDHLAAHVDDEHGHAVLRHGEESVGRERWEHGCSAETRAARARARVASRGPLVLCRRAALGVSRPGERVGAPYWRIAGAAGRRGRRGGQGAWAAAAAGAVRAQRERRCRRRSLGRRPPMRASICDDARGRPRTTLRAGHTRRRRPTRPAAASAGATPRPRPLFCGGQQGTSLLRALAPRPAPPPPAPTAALPRLAGAAVHTVVEPRALHAPCRSSSRP